MTVENKLSLGPRRTTKVRAIRLPNNKKRIPHCKQCCRSKDTVQLSAPKDRMEVRRPSRAGTPISATFLQRLPDVSNHQIGQTPTNSNFYTFKSSSTVSKCEMTKLTLRGRLLSSRTPEGTTWSELPKGNQEPQGPRSRLKKI